MVRLTAEAVQSSYAAVASKSAASRLKDMSPLSMTKCKACAPSGGCYDAIGKRPLRAASGLRPRPRLSGQTSVDGSSKVVPMLVPVMVGAMAFLITMLLSLYIYIYTHTHICFS